MALRFNPPPGWPTPPAGFVPSADWQPDPSWPPAPPGWQLWVDDGYPAATSQFGATGQPGASGWTSAPPWPSPEASGTNWYVPPPQGTNGLAVASFVLGIFGITLIALVLSIVFGIIALVRVRQSGQRGRGFAIAGLVLSGLWIVGYVLIIVAAVQAGPPATGGNGPSASAVPSAGAPVNVFSLVTGDCFDNPTSPSAGQQSVKSVVQTPCTQAHNAQIYATFNVKGSMLAYPGEAQLRSMASNRCGALAKGSLDRTKLTDSETIRFLFPLESSWLTGHRTVSCMIVSPTSNVTSSLLKS